MRASRSLLLGCSAAALTLAVTGCGSSTGAVGPSSGSSTSGTAAVHVDVVASTDVWGDVVTQVAGDLAGSTVRITSIITDPDADPHSYEASTQNQLALSKANLVVENGGGYDDFVDTMLKTADNASATVLDAVDISGKTPDADGELNEHVWYDLPTVRAVAAQVAGVLAKADPDNAATYAANQQTFARDLTDLESTEAQIKAAHGGEGVAITEPVPLYLLQACGLENRTPAEFSEAVEEGTDVSASVLDETEKLFDDKDVALLAYNEQTSGPETEAVLRAARANDIPVVPVRETLPAGKDYVAWMTANLDAVRTALG
jgi:zinc/manganese transport system substrate-binding protein